MLRSGKTSRARTAEQRGLRLCGARDILRRSLSGNGIQLIARRAGKHFINQRESLSDIFVTEPKVAKVGNALAAVFARRPDRLEGESKPVHDSRQRFRGQEEPVPDIVSFAVVASRVQ